MTRNTPDSLRLTVNGNAMAAQAETLADLLRHLTLDAAAVVAEVNGVIVPRENFARHPLKDGDIVELVRFVGGG